MNENHSLPAFHFRILFKGLDDLSEADSRFQSVSGLKVAAAIPENVDGAINKSASFLSPLVLKRAVENTSNSQLRRWVLDCLNKSSREPLPEVLIEVLDEEHKPGFIVRLTKVTAAGWELGELNALKSELLMEEITLQYQSIEVIPV
jgi:phage tail-like protein